MSLPKGYDKDIARVSTVVSYLHPFAGYGKGEYLKWIYEKLRGIVPYNGETNEKKRNEIIEEFPAFSGVYDIDKMIVCEEEYLTEAQDVGTFVHLQMENKVEGDDQNTDHPLYSKHIDVINHGLDYIDELDKNKTSGEWISEPYVRDELDRYQGSVDLVRICEETKTVWIYDWKTWGIAKKRYGLPNTYRKPYSKIKKVALQMSLYAETYRQKGYKIGGIYGVWLHETGAYEYPLEMWSKVDIDNLLTKFMLKDTMLPREYTLHITYNKMIRVEVQTVIDGLAYSKASVIVEHGDFDEAKTPQETIVKAIELQKYLLQQYKN